MLLPRGQVRSLFLSHTRISDAGMAHLAQLPRLQELVLNGTQVTDAGLVYLGGMTSLQPT
jgi:hypothetical protein